MSERKVPHGFKTCPACSNLVKGPRTKVCPTCSHEFVKGGAKPKPVAVRKLKTIAPVPAPAPVTIPDPYTTVDIAGPDFVGIATKVIEPDGLHNRPVGFRRRVAANVNMPKRDAKMLAFATSVKAVKVVGVPSNVAFVGI